MLQITRNLQYSEAAEFSLRPLNRESFQQNKGIKQTELSHKGFPLLSGVTMLTLVPRATAHLHCSI